MQWWAPPHSLGTPPMTARQHRVIPAPVSASGWWYVAETVADLTGCDCIRFYHKSQEMSKNLDRLYAPAVAPPLTATGPATGRIPAEAAGRHAARVLRQIIAIQSQILFDTHKYGDYLYFDSCRTIVT